jgi:hypothetical protein
MEILLFSLLCCLLIDVVDVDSTEVVERVVTQCCVSVRFSNGLIFIALIVT